MPTLNWIGKEAVVDHHRHIPTRLLECDPKLSFGDPDAENLLVEGDNLEALKALLPRYRGQVKCIYIDPPYNTGNENWIYNDNVNDPRIKKWLGQVVGKEAEDLCRHDKWLCMMYPRVAMLREFLQEDGLIFVSIDDDEVGHLRLLLDEIFGAGNFIANIVWQKRYVSNVTAKYLSDMHDHILVYAKNPQLVTTSKIPRTDEQLTAYKNPDNDPRGVWRAQDLSASKPYSAGQFEITGPTGLKFNPPPNRYWRCNKEQFDKWNSDNRIWWGTQSTARPMLKRFISEVQDGLTPNTWWDYEFAGHNKAATLELKEIFGGDAPFDTPKPVQLIERILQVFGTTDSIVLDSFAGSGTTGHAVLKLNAQDGGTRRAILVELDPNVATSATRRRLHHVVEGFDAQVTRTSTRRVEGLGSGFRYCKLGRTLLDEFGDINGEVPFTDLARYVYLLETGVPIPKRPKKDCPLLGVHQGRAIYLLYNGVLGDRRPAGGNVLTNSVLAGLPPHPEGKGSRVIFGEATRLSESTLARENIVFRQIPYSLRES